ncbi:alpha/beta hydrolase [Stutzerimonas nosocomialis]|uniref:alpha/beta hydrolase n=1 Tax=Stutzerimonas nosocomialis TaxID=1056496 RepID=UPI001109A521|nr:alpha/beta fold hydrolase [Stutzerimonas nosocomialis]TLX57272.1 alpha/beta hydrolase [Stutzerimonas nosocomialis]
MRLLLIALLAMLAPSLQAQTLLQQPVRLETPTGALHGSLMLPKRDTAVPVALLIAGSGPTDRDGNNPDAHNDALKRLAQTLARLGVASVRYDKRGIAASRPAAPDERDLSVEGYVEDAVGWVRQLRQDARFASVILIGHSEGALIASLTAPVAQAEAVISIAGTGEPVDILLRDQLQGRLPPPLLATSFYLLDELKAGRQHADIPPPLQALFRPSVQPYLISLFRQDPAEAFAALQMPALIIQGRHDIQVSVADAKALHRAKPDAELALIDGMNHVLRIVPAERNRQMASYNDPSLPIARALGEHIGRFLRTHGLLPPSS